MPGTVTTNQLPGGGVSVLLEQALTAIGVTDWVRLASKAELQLTGVATAVTVQLERSTSDPAGTANPAPVGNAASGNPSTGMAVITADEAGAAWWRARVTALTGASVAIALSGRGVATPAAIVGSRAATPRLVHLRLSVSTATAGIDFTAEVQGATAGSELRLTRNPGGRWSLSGTTLTGRGLAYGKETPAITEYPGTSGALGPRETEFRVDVAQGAASYIAAVPGDGASWSGVYSAERLLASWAGAVATTAGGAAVASAGAGASASDVAALRGSDEAVNLQQIADQSGNGRHLVQATDGSRPRLHEDVSFNGVLPLIFDGHRTQVARLASTATHHALNRQDFTLFLVIDPTNSMNQQCYFSFNNAGDQNNATLNDLQDPGYAGGQYIGVNGGFAGGISFSGKWLPANPTVLVIRGSAAAMDYFILGQKSSGVAAAAGTLQQFNLGTLPGAGNYSSNWRCFAALLANKALTDAEVAARTAELNARFKIPTAYDRVVVTVGTSRVAGGSGTLTRNKAWYQRPLLGARTLTYNFGIDGDTVSNAYANRAARANGAYRADLPVIYVLDDFINDLGGLGASTDPATIYTTITNFKGALKALGANVKVVIETTVPQDGTTYGADPVRTQIEARRQTLNTAISGNAAAADAVADPGGDATIGAYPAAPNNAALYTADKLHQTSAGYALGARFAPAKINALAA